mgnify:CR=1 FL=1
MTTSAEAAVREVPIDLFDAKLLEELTQELRSRHQLAGAMVDWKHPVVAVRLPQKEVKRPSSQLVFNATAKTSDFGASLNLDVRFTQSGEWCHAALATLSIQATDGHLQLGLIIHSGQYFVIFFDGLSLAYAYFVDFATGADSFATQREIVAHHRPLVIDPDAHFWAVLSEASHLHRYLTVSDRLSIGWVQSYAARVADLQRELSDLGRDSPISADLKDVELEFLQTVLATVRNHDYDLIRVFEGFRRGGNQGCQLGFFYHSIYGLSSHAELGKYENTLYELCGILTWSSWFSECGKRFPWIDSQSKVGEICTFDITPHEFPEWFPPENYWKCVVWDLKYELGRILTGGDVPLDVREWKKDRSLFPRASENDEVSNLANNLLDDAIEHKTWTIPRRAIVEQQIGIFTHIELHELGGNVFCVFRTAKGECYAAAVCPARHVGTFIVPAGIEEDVDTTRAIEVGVHMLLCAVIRDFWVVEERERVFGVKRQTFQRGRRPILNEEPRVVYLPRIKYTASANPTEATKELGYPERRTHSVAPHLRRVGIASDSQLILAQRYGFDVPEGFTFVRPHLRGKGQINVVYKSRSALQSLYQADVKIAGDATTVDWFEFERDVANLMAKLGFQVQHVAASRHGDNGVDVFATKGSDFDRVNWVIQCKCWKPTRKISPSTVRELCGVLADYPHGTRGMIVTTSSFSSGARDAAVASDIRLVDGEEFAKLIEIA